MWQCAVGKQALFMPLLFSVMFMTLLVIIVDVMCVIAGQGALREPCRNPGQPGHHAGL